ncbi:MAG TPA: ATP-binding protein [Ktedonobacterales bacterium]|nr:ATP-binding protein [Ktedonobacterales bacterium]
MSRVVAALQSLWPWHHSLSQEAGGEMFTRVRRQLTFWYTAVLAGMLIIFGIALYFSVQQLLYRSVPEDVSSRAYFYATHWQPFQSQPCWQGDQNGFPSNDNKPPPSFISGGESILVACFDANGNLLQVSDPDGAKTPFVTNSLVSQALENGPATGIIRNDNNYGDVYTYAVAVADPSGNVLGVVQVGESIHTQETVLNLLLVLLLILGAGTLAAAALGGLLLADRALEPTRLAFTRQQAFIADASHELRTPLTLMRADAEVLLAGRERLDPDDALLLEDIVTEAGHMGVLANNMLTLARLDAGQFHQEQEVIDLAAVATRAAHRAHAFAQEKQVTLCVEQPEAGQALVIGDKSLLEQATMILVDNAIKYNRAGGSLTLRAGLLQGQAYLEVSDTGIGIASEHLSHLGERFYRVDKARSREAGGAGLGLSIARGIAASHGGSLTLSSVAGQGTTARILLPPARGSGVQA